MKTLESRLRIRMSPQIFNKIFKKPFWACQLGPGEVVDEKTETEKSRDTVPLRICLISNLLLKFMVNINILWLQQILLWTVFNRFLYLTTYNPCSFVVSLKKITKKPPIWLGSGSHLYYAGRQYGRFIIDLSPLGLSVPVFDVSYMSVFLAELGTKINITLALSILFRAL